jgi:hypothetical protein
MRVLWQVLLALLLSTMGQTQDVAILIGQDPEIDDPDNGAAWYLIDGTSETYYMFQEKKFHNQYNDFRSTRPCFEFLRTVTIQYMGKQAPGASSYYDNYLAAKNSDLSWGLDVEIANAQTYDTSTYFPRCGALYDTTSATSRCVNCMSTAFRVTLFIARTPSVNIWDGGTLSAVCEVGQKRNCAPVECPNGKFATSGVSMLNGFSVNNGGCSDCLPGSWLTCHSKPECMWKVPAPNSRFEPGNDVVKSTPDPLGKCYACSQASIFGHYVYAGSDKQVTLQGAGGYICPGGAKPPSLCPANTIPNGDMTACKCVDGYYMPTEGSACIKCERGYNCSSGVKTRCPMHYYQMEEGKTDCNPCSVGGAAGGYGKANCGENMLQQFCDSAGDLLTQTQDLGFNCVPCTRCRRPYLHEIPNAVGTVNCYRG